MKTCQVTGSAFRGQGSQKGPDGKSVKATIYEVTCQTGPGYLVVANEGQPKPQMVNCIIAAQGGTKCVLPPNLDPKTELAGYVSATGRTCAISDQRYVGSSSNGMTYYELGCGTAPGFLLAVSETEAKPPQVTDCMAVVGTAQACTLTTKAQMLSVYAPAVAQSGKACQISDVRSIGASKVNGDIFTEIACGAAAGLRARAGQGGRLQDHHRLRQGPEPRRLRNDRRHGRQDRRRRGLHQAGVQGGLPLPGLPSTASSASTRRTARWWSWRAATRPDGAMAVLSETGHSDVYDCVRAPVVSGQSCKLTDASVVYPKYTAALVSKGRTACKVSRRGLPRPHPGGGLEFVETACSDGAPGWVMGLKPGATTPDELLTCRQSANSGLPCKLPANVSALKG